MKPGSTRSSLSKLRMSNPPPTNQQQRQRDLRHDERAAHAIPLCALAATAPALFQHRVQFGPRELNGRSQPKQPARHYRHRQREEQHARINPDIFATDEVLRQIIRNAASPHCASNNPKPPPARLSSDASVNNCRMSRHLPAPRAARTAISRWRANPRASSRFAKFAQAINKNHADSGEEQIQHPPQPADHDFAEVFNLRAAFRTFSGISQRQLIGDGVHLGLRLRQTGARFQMPDAQQQPEIPLRRIAGIGGRPHPYLYLGIERLSEIRRYDADHAERFAVGRISFLPVRFGSPPNRSCQIFSLTTTTFSAPGRSSPGVNVRPTTAAEIEDLKEIGRHVCAAHTIGRVRCPSD